MPDAADARVDWPRFTLVTYSAPTGIPHGWDAELLAKGAPDGLVIKAEHDLTLLEAPSYGPLMCFGTTGAHGRVCLDPRTQHVVHVEYGAFQTGNPQAEVVGSPNLVGSSLEQLIEMVRAVTERFPFDSDLTWDDREGEADEEKEARDERLLNEWAQAVVDLAEILDRIDPAAFADPGEFWHTFVADVSMGNYSTEDILHPPEE